MTEKSLPYGRRSQILKLLAIHGPLSVRGLQLILEPKMKRRRLQDALQRLRANDLVIQMNESVFGGAGIYYRLTADESFVPTIKKLTGFLIEELNTPSIKNQELLHSETCAVWAETFKKILPGAQVLREHEFVKSEIAKRILFSTNDVFELRPDILLLAKTESGASVSIGVEVERNRKTNKRIREKLRKYASGTLLDGTIYICEQDCIANQIRDIYSQQILLRSHRIKHYGEYFLLFHNKVLPSLLSELCFFTPTLKRIALQDWMRLLTASTFSKRRDAHFENQQPGAEGLNLQTEKNQLKESI